MNFELTPLVIFTIFIAILLFYFAYKLTRFIYKLTFTGIALWYLWEFTLPRISVWLGLLDESRLKTVLEYFNNIKDLILHNISR